MKKNLVINSLFLAVSLILSACANTAPTQDAGQTATQAAAQMEAQVATRVAQALAALEATQKAQPTPAAVNIPTPSLPGEPTSVDCNPPPLAMGENYPDGTTIYINTAFNKSWTIQNAGTCTWNSNYKIKFYSGDAMSGPSFKLFGASVPPGGSITLTLPLKAPGAAGTTKGIWGLYDDKDVWFGQVWVTINSVTGSPLSTAFSVTSVTTAVDNAGPVSCKSRHTFNFTATIYANGAGTVNYYWTNSDLANSPTHTLTFGAAGTKTVVYSWALGPGASGRHWVKVYIDSPNHQYFSPVNFTCF